jgi:cyanophycinase
MKLFNAGVNAKNKKGYLVLIGGAEDRRNGKTILKRCVELNNARTVAVIPSASSYPTGLAEDYFYAFRDLGVDVVNTIDVRDRSDAEREEYLEKTASADMIFFTGGDQVKLVHILNNTKMLDLIREMHARGITIAGTSAGAAAASNPLLCDGDDRGLIKGSINIHEGFGFIEKITIDTHFVNRGRIGRLTQFLVTGQSNRGIGLGEDTAIVVSPDETFEVIGSELVTVISTDSIHYSNYDKISEDMPIAIDGINVGFLPPGTVFSLKEWKILSAVSEKKAHSVIFNDYRP